MVHVQPSIPRIAIVLVAIAAVAVAAAGVPFGGPVDRDVNPESPAATPTPEPLEPQTDAGLPFGLLTDAVRYVFGGALLALTLVATLALYRNLSGSDSLETDSAFEPDREPLDPGPEALEPVAEAAGRAADRIERGGAIDNEVYRAWKEMTRSLSVRNPRSRTPGEFAVAAVRAGMDPGDVRALTELFEAARYGTLEPGEAEERRAVALLRRIESEHGGDAE